VKQFSLVLELVPHQYSLSQAALSARNDARQQLGQGAGDGLSTWLWGRGVRFPGHYILAYILARRAFVPEFQDAVTIDKKEQQDAAIKEILLVAVLAAAYNYLLLVYGLDY